MLTCLFASDLHGDEGRYRRLFAAIHDERPGAVFLGGDLLPSRRATVDGDDSRDFVTDVLWAGFSSVQAALQTRAPEVFLIPGNDDPRAEEQHLLAGEAGGLWHHAHGRKLALHQHTVYGYAFVPPTPFRLKDWERYDISRHVDPGCISPEEGSRSVPADPHDARWGTIGGDLERLAPEDDLGRAIFLFHAPPHDTALDRAALDGMHVEHVPLHVHVGSIAIRRFIERRQPRLTLHGHIHEAARLTGTWRIKLGGTHCFTAAHDGPELALVRFDLDRLDEATRELLPVA